MKKLFFACMAIITLGACQGEREYLDFRGLSMAMSAKAMCDSLQTRGFELDTNLTDETTYVLHNAKDLSRVDIVFRNDTISDILESYTASYNDSTTKIYRELHKQFTDTYGWSNMIHDSDLHREAQFNTGGKGGLILNLHNTYSPTLTIRYSTEEIKY